MNDDDLRHLVRTTAEDITPRGTYDDVRRRTDEVIEMNRNRFLPVLGAAVVTAAVIAGVVALTTGGEDPGSAPGPADTPTATVPDSSPSPPDGADVPTVAAAVYYLGDTPDGPRLFREWHRVPSGSDGGVEASLVRAMGTAPSDPDYRTLWSPDDDVRAAPGDGGVIGIYFSAAPSHPADRPAGMTEAEARMSIQQLVYTAQAQLKSTDPVAFYGDDGEGVERLDRLLGVDVSERTTRGDGDSTLAPVSIDKPADGDSVEGPVTVTGRAAAFEATVEWELRQGDTVVDQGSAMADECCTLSPYEFTLDAAPGDYTLVVRQSDPSGGEGGGPAEDTKVFTVE